ncbi:MAG: alpha/beta hydrolase [Betaproteobacteria bacterium]|nr:alpha/beta hydrolase [Betaproteobacteria bacterium]
MPVATVRRAAIHYQIVGEKGPWVSLSPGGRRAIEGVRSLGERIAQAGYRVLLHDRRNCGASDVIIDGDESEYDIWADDLHALLTQLGAAPAYVGGASSGCRMAILFALRHPQAVRALLLWRVTGGRIAAEHLAHQYYTDYIELAQRGGMAAVCESEHFRERIAARPENRARLMAMEPQRFIAVMSHWREYFIAGADQPVIGASEDELRAIRVPACIVPGNDRIHARRAGENVGRLIPGAEVRDIMPPGPDLDDIPFAEWDRREGELATVFLDFLKRADAARR